MNSWEHTGRQMEKEVRVAADRERAYKAWAEAEHIRRWFTDDATGRAVVGETMTWSFDQFAQGIPYTVVAASPGERFALGYEGPDGRAGLLEIKLRPEGGETVVRLVNSGFREGVQWDEEYEGVSSGWGCALALLKMYVEKYWGEEKRTFLTMQPAEFEYADLRLWYETPQGVSKWSGVPPEELRLIADTGRETAYEWTRVRGTLECKAFQGGPQRMLCVRIVSWGGSSGPDPAHLPAEMLKRLKNLLLS